MEVSDLSRAMAAAVSTAVGLDLAVDDAVVLHNSNKLALRLLPCDVLARVARVGHEVALRSSKSTSLNGSPIPGAQLPFLSLEWNRGSTSVTASQ